MGRMVRVSGTVPSPSRLGGPIPRIALHGVHRSRTGRTCDANDLARRTSSGGQQGSCTPFCRSTCGKVSHITSEDVKASLPNDQPRPFPPSGRSVFTVPCSTDRDDGEGTPPEGREVGSPGEHGCEPRPPHRGVGQDAPGGNKSGPRPQGDTCRAKDRADLAAAKGPARAEPEWDSQPGQLGQEPQTCFGVLARSERRAAKPRDGRNGATGAGETKAGRTTERPTRATSDMERREGEQEAEPCRVPWPRANLTCRRRDRWPISPEGTEGATVSVVSGAEVGAK